MRPRRALAAPRLHGPRALQGALFLVLEYRFTEITRSNYTRRGDLLAAPITLRTSLN